MTPLPALLTLLATMLVAALPAAVGRGVLHLVRPLDLGGVLLADVVLLALVLGIMAMISRRLGLPRPDEIVVVFCGGNKGLVTGVSMLSALLPADVAGIAVLPLIVFHQLQLIMSAGLAARYARRPVLGSQR